MSFIDGGRGWLTSYDDIPMPQTIGAEVTAEAASLDVAAIGDQLGVAWTDGQSAVHFRLLQANLQALE